MATKNRTEDPGLRTELKAQDSRDSALSPQHSVLSAPVLSPQHSVLSAALPGLTKALHAMARQLAPTSPVVGRDDLVQEGWLGVLRAAQHYDPASGVPFGTYARYRAWGAMRDLLRQDHQRPRQVDAPHYQQRRAWTRELREAHAPAPETLLLAAEATRWLRRTAATLAPGLAQTYQRLYVEEWSGRELAQETGRTRGTVHATAWAVRQHLQQRAREEHQHV